MVTTMIGPSSGLGSMQKEKCMTPRRNDILWIYYSSYSTMTLVFSQPSDRDSVVQIWWLLRYYEQYFLKVLQYHVFGWISATRSKTDGWNCLLQGTLCSCLRGPRSLLDQQRHSQGTGVIPVKGRPVAVAFPATGGVSAPQLNTACDHSRRGEQGPYVKKKRGRCISHIWIVSATAEINFVSIFNTLSVCVFFFTFTA
jgi:hypothetical protein